MNGEVVVQTQFNTKTGDLHVFSRFQLGKTAAKHITSVTEAAKLCVTEYKEFLKKNPDLNEEAKVKGAMLKVLTQFGVNENATTKDGLVKAGDELVRQGFLVSNTLLRDYQDGHPDYTDGEIQFANLPF